MTAMGARGLCSRQQQAAAPAQSRQTGAARPQQGHRRSAVGSHVTTAASTPQRRSAPLPRRAVRAAAAAAAASDVAPAPAASPATQQLPETVPWQEAGQGLVFYADGSTSFRVWAPHASAVVLQVVPAGRFVPAPTPAPAPPATGEGSSEAAPPPAATQGDDVAQPGMVEHPLERHSDDYGISLPAGALAHGAAYRLVVTGPGGMRLLRRDPWTRSPDLASSWAFAHSPAAYTWRNTGWQPLSYDRVGAAAGCGACGGGRRAGRDGLSAGGARCRLSSSPAAALSLLA